jgi:O-acetyl-ADP-ribose deacetylase (regulator of RNase III)
MKIELLRGDITQLKVDAIVNAANSSLLPGGGVCGAIFRGGGKAIDEECLQIRNQQGECNTGEAVITTAGSLPSKFVIHTVGPVWSGGQNNEAELLKKCYQNSIQLAVEHNLKNIAFPNISTGIFGYPKEEAAQIAVATVQSLKQPIVKKVIFVCFDEENYQLYQKILK